MAKDFSKAFYNSAKWKKCRKAYLSVYPYCNRCASLGIVEPAVHVHHKIYLTQENITNPDITLNWDNLEGLCHNCHTQEHLGKNDVRYGLMFDSDGNLAPYLEGVCDSSERVLETDEQLKNRPQTKKFMRGG